MPWAKKVWKILRKTPEAKHAYTGSDITMSDLKVTTWVSAFSWALNSLARRQAGSTRIADSRGSGVKAGD
jgi:hypothetical protein